mmetsp:Transcript_11671/g.37024  ORF Transcript_11671/g.37024 Transcript_11671/m.37024 type:complete len:250 (-) Transcript_11671:117-866(-)
MSISKVRPGSISRSSAPAAPFAPPSLPPSPPSSPSLHRCARQQEYAGSEVGEASVELGSAEAMRLDRRDERHGAGGVVPATTPLTLVDLIRARGARREAPPLPPQDDEQLIDLRPVMELSPVTVLHTTPLPRLHHLFRSLGLARLWIIDTRNQPVGVVTRHDLLPEALRRRVPKHREARLAEALRSLVRSRHSRTADRQKPRQQRLPPHEHRSRRGSWLPSPERRAVGHGWSRVGRLDASSDSVRSYDV